MSHLQFTRNNDKQNKQIDLKYLFQMALENLFFVTSIKFPKSV